jgi:undecaprenyl diphosphate synthase
MSSKLSLSSSSDLTDPDHLHLEQNPRHVAIILDGNGRWAQERHLPRTEGHRRGVQAVRAAVEYAAQQEIDCLTLFCFSSENWSRPQDEINELFRLLKFFIRRELAELHNAGIKISAMGDIDGLDRETRALLSEAADVTSANQGMRLCVAVNYGARAEIIKAVAALVERGANGSLSGSDVTEEMLRAELSVPDVPDPDLIIRTSGEQRLSNFMLWQAAYAELYFPPVLWPDFTNKHFEEALQVYRKRNRRFGGLSQQAV